MSPQKRCSKGSRKNRKSGKCESTTSRRKQSKSNKRCKTGFRKNKQGKCQPHNRPSRKSTKRTKSPSARPLSARPSSARRKTPSARPPSAHRKTPSARPPSARKSPSRTSPVRDFTQRMGMNVQNKKMCCRGSDESGRSREAALNTLCFDQDATPTPAEITKNYRNCSLQVHPDKNRSDPRAKEFFQNVNNANDKLKERRVEE